MGVGYSLEIQPVRCARREWRMAGRFLAWPKQLEERSARNSDEDNSVWGRFWAGNQCSDLGSWNLDRNSNHPSGENEALSWAAAVEMDKVPCIPEIAILDNTKQNVEFALNWRGQRGRS